MQMIVPGCNECIDTNLSILDANAVDDHDFSYDLECELARHNETHSLQDNDRRVSWSIGLRQVGVLV